MDAPPIKILHLEDVAADAKLIHRVLERAGLRFTLRRVDSEQPFRAAIADEMPDVILADQVLPGFDGMSALRIVREIAPAVPFIFVSGSLGEERAIQTLHEGAADYILKDRLTRLPSAIERALEERASQRAREAAEAAVAESEQRFRYATLATRDVIWDHDVVTGRIFVNESLQTQWGHEERACIDIEWLISNVHPDDRAGVSASYERFLASKKERWTIEHRFRRGDGWYGYCVQRALVLRDADGRPLRVIGAMQDVTESRRLQDQLERAERVESLGRIAATIAHEFNNVLMGIQPIAEVLMRASEARTARMGSKIVESVVRGRTVVDEILRISRVPDPVLETFDLAAFVRDMRAEAEAVVGRNIAVDIATPPRPAWIRCDRRQLQQVLANLIVNARDAMPRGGRLSLAVASRDAEVVLSVSDDGSGMPAEIRDRVFEPLFTTKRHGTGLGLAVSERLLRQNNASITVDSAVGQGTTFRITFAAADERPAETGETLPLRRLNLPLRILIVEDNVNVADGIRILLESEGFEAHVIEHGEYALDAVNALKPDVLLLDVSLPDISGAEVFDRVRAVDPDLPVVFMSGHIEAARLDDRIGNPNVGFMRKPFGLETLLKILDQTLPAAEQRMSDGGANVSTGV